MADKNVVSYDAQEVLKRFKAAKERRQSWDKWLEDCYLYMMPGRNPFDESEDGNPDDEHVFDSTAPTAIRRFTAFLKESLVPVGSDWAVLEAGVEVEPENKEQVNQQLKVISRTVMNAIRQSNFDSQAMEMFYDLAIGTGAMLVKDNGDYNDPIMFESVPLNQVYPEEGPHGTIETVFRNWDIPARNIKRQWPDAKLSDTLNRKIENKPDTRLSVIEATIYNPKQQNYSYCVVVETGKEKIYESKFDVSPWLLPRWDKRSGEILGRGPAYDVLPDVKTLNEVVKMTLMNAEMAVSNIYTVVQDGVLNLQNVSFEPNTFIPVAMNGGEAGPTIQPLPTNANFNVGQMTMEGLRKIISDTFYIDAIGVEAGPVRTATEVSIKRQEQLQSLGAAAGRLQVEFIQKLIKRVYFILKKYGLVPDLEVDGKVISIKTLAPLSTTQELKDAQNTLQFYQMVGSMSPQMLPAVVKPETVIWIGQALGVPVDKLPTSDEFKMALENMAQAAAQMQQQQMPQ